MESALNIFGVISGLVCLGSVIFVTVSVRHEISRAKNTKHKAEEKIRQFVRAFVPAAAHDNPGRTFAILVEAGYFTSFRMGNHGQSFNYDRQLNDFRKYNTIKISDALKKVGKNHERYYI